MGPLAWDISRCEWASLRILIFRVEELIPAFPYRSGLTLRRYLRGWHYPRTRKFLRVSNLVREWRPVEVLAKKCCAFLKLRVYGALCSSVFQRRNRNQAANADETTAASPKLTTTVTKNPILNYNCTVPSSEKDAQKTILSVVWCTTVHSTIIN